MGVFDALNVSASGLTAQRLRMDVASSNMANVDSTRGRLLENGEWEPYRRKMVVLGSSESSFKSMYNKAVDNGDLSGVKVNQIKNDETPFKSVYQPDHPDADEEGFVRLPNVDPLKEMVDLMSATRSYEANVTALNAAKGMYLKALEIGR
ncbi:flagellar basal body rod protein FlgC [Fictibacillus barbaricus]|uniref:Flagellar basal-body rod protein FlgC n=1 Tax=Fictibacillus barbaricus TaxID=182136 RepID=A0ABS2ZET9_9BACL|nr:flagellar basal body rod protein FlgC [Fictibacillus barbaricus]MBN3545852.1 flagellar basal body rod protein FlgC [Fictibacillus barbaricus]GGB56653.1 flagellar basal-body rod protein FlgC [Fictibacillus barbaricus]